MAVLKFGHLCLGALYLPKITAQTSIRSYLGNNGKVASSKKIPQSLKMTDQPARLLKAL